MSSFRGVDDLARVLRQAATAIDEEDKSGSSSTAKVARQLRAEVDLVSATAEPSIPRLLEIKAELHGIASRRETYEMRDLTRRLGELPTPSATPIPDHLDGFGVEGEIRRFHPEAAAITEAVWAILVEKKNGGQLDVDGAEALRALASLSAEIGRARKERGEHLPRTDTDFWSYPARGGLKAVLPLFAAQSELGERVRELYQQQVIAPGLQAKPIDPERSQKSAEGEHTIADQLIAHLLDPSYGLDGSYFIMSDGRVLDGFIPQTGRDRLTLEISTNEGESYVAHQVPVGDLFSVYHREGYLLVSRPKIEAAAEQHRGLPSADATSALMQKLVGFAGIAELLLKDGSKQPLKVTGVQAPGAGSQARNLIISGRRPSDIELANRWPDEAYRYSKIFSYELPLIASLTIGGQEIYSAANGVAAGERPKGRSHYAGAFTGAQLAIAVESATRLGGPISDKMIQAIADASPGSSAPAKWTAAEEVIVMNALYDMNGSALLWPVAKRAELLELLRTDQIDQFLVMVGEVRPGA